MKGDLDSLRHSASHVLAQAVLELFPKTKLAIGPPIENGFYYDFDTKKPFSPEDLENIEKRALEIIKKDLKIKKVLKTKAEAKKLLKDNKYKLELLEEIKGKPSFYQQGDFIDLCAGPHVSSTGEIKGFKLLNLAGAYWRGDSKNKMLQRIYGTAFYDKKELKKYLHMLEEAKKRDHIKLGKELDLFIISDVVGKGLPLFTPRGATIKRTLKRFIEDEEIKRGYQFTDTPVLSKTDLYKISGHLDHYKKDMFVFKVNGEEMALRPMTCPHQFMIYKSKVRSHKELPIRYAETADLFRNEKSGELHGLIRIRQFCLADAHIFCTPKQLENEFEGVVDLIQYVMKTLGFKDYWYRFSKWDPKNKKKYIDNSKAWNSSQKMMKKILDKMKLKYVEAEGEAAFYGPKLDIQMRNVHGKEDTMFTVQIDFALPERFDMSYDAENGRKARPMIIHRSSIGCIERTIALLIENYAGKFPLWLSPVQVKILPMTDRSNKFSEELKEKLEKNNLRVEIDYRSESMSKKVRDAQKEKIPISIILGDKEVKNKTLAVRALDGSQKFGMTLDKFIKTVSKNIESKSQTISFK